MHCLVSNSSDEPSIGVYHPFPPTAAGHPRCRYTRGEPDKSCSPVYNYRAKNLCEGGSAALSIEMSEGGGCLWRLELQKRETHFVSSFLSTVVIFSPRRDNLSWFHRFPLNTYCFNSRQLVAGIFTVGQNVISIVLGLRTILAVTF